MNSPRGPLTPTELRLPPSPLAIGWTPIILRAESATAYLMCTARRLRLSASFTSISAASASLKPRKLSTFPTVHPTDSTLTRFDLFKSNFLYSQSIIGR